jgi:hypothetical protein
MDIGPLEYVVIGLQNHQCAHEILSELDTIQQNGLIRVVDLLFVGKAADGVVTMQEVNELHEKEQQSSHSTAEAFKGWLTAQDVEHLAKDIPPGIVAVMVLLEHTWTLGLANAVRQSGGVLFTGGMVAPETLAQVSAELGAAKEEYDA